MNDLKVVFFGTPDYIDPIIKALDNNFGHIQTIHSPAFQPGACLPARQVVKLNLNRVEGSHT